MFHEILRKLEEERERERERDRSRVIVICFPNVSQCRRHKVIVPSISSHVTLFAKSVQIGRTRGCWNNFESFSVHDAFGILNFQLRSLTISNRTYLFVNDNCINTRRVRETSSGGRCNYSRISKELELERFEKCVNFISSMLIQHQRITNSY